MSDIGFILEGLTRQPGPALFWRGETYDGCRLVEQVREDIKYFRGQGIGPGSVVVLRGDYSPRSVSLLLAFIELKPVLAPLLPATLAKAPFLVDIVNPSFLAEVDLADTVTIARRQPAETHELVRKVQERGSPGLILF